ncbi:DUF190 domain-containing protein [Marinomonas pollencensis]|uniref:Uncharacterized protein DUF190 n=1 Tax=Marinomonas pollencensis TaxID=491954 RepID=A0A3E0DNA4_9GAMM|nr:DUF190 domain-containing protein [Marinomonas pollencensis]REG83656.1 uncharacterized protein DUF190 [Marinomonas pollencensis]
MKGSQITFYTYYGRVYDNRNVPEYLMALATELSLPGATMSSGLMGIGHHGEAHNKTWLDDSDEPMQVTFIVTLEQEAELFERLAKDQVKIFYTRTEVDFGYSGIE